MADGTICNRQDESEVHVTVNVDRQCCDSRHCEGTAGYHSRETEYAVPAVVFTRKSATQADGCVETRDFRQSDCQCGLGVRRESHVGPSKESLGYLDGTRNGSLPRTVPPRMVGKFDRNRKPADKREAASLLDEDVSERRPVHFASASWKSRKAGEVLMTIKTVSIGVLNRWVVAGLNSSIATLYAGGEGTSSSQNKAGSPAGTDKPRAEYVVMFPPPSVKTRHSRIHVAAVMFTVYGSTKELTDNYISLIHSAFVNSDAAGTPLSISNGDVLEVDDGGAGVEKVDDDTYQGEQTIFVRCRINNLVPA